MAAKRTILVTGCSTGIGAYCAERLRDDGWHVLATARSDADLARLRADGFDAFYLEHTAPESIEALFDTVLETTGGTLDALFNNAGYAQPGAVEDLPIDALREQMEVNFFAYHAMMLRAVPIMRAQGHGRIVNCSSVLGRICVPWRGAYTASKFALNALTMTMRQELEGSNIFASVIELGAIPSNIAQTGARYAEKYIDIENSVHKAAYAKRIGGLKSQEPPTDLSGAEPVYKALKHALDAKRPKPHYPVKRETHGAFWAMRVLPRDFFYRLIGRMA